MKELIGRKVKGFKFEHGTNKINYIYGDAGMDKYIGKIGTIIKICDRKAVVEFEDTTLAYPTSLIEQNLVPDNPLDSLPMLGEGILCEVWDDGHEHYKRFICARTPNVYVAWNDAQKKENIDYTGGIVWENASPIEPVKQYTKEQLEQMVGHKFELI
jgi:hypothetical protein